jgi:DNA-binding XRE family transcriptional regulator
MKTKRRRKADGTRDIVPGFGAVIRTARQTAGLTQQQTDAAAGLPAGTTAQLEHDRRGPTLRLALMVARALSLDLNTLRDNFTNS